MAMGDTGGSMGEMEMPLPDNTLPMMTGRGPFGPVEMGGMFSTVKVGATWRGMITGTRAGIARRPARSRGNGWARPRGTAGGAFRPGCTGHAGVIKPGGQQGHH
jgi:hypothetical protein